MSYLSDIHLYNVPACDITTLMLLRRDSSVELANKENNAIDRLYLKPVIHIVKTLQGGYMLPHTICKLSITF